MEPHITQGRKDFAHGRLQGGGGKRQQTSVLTKKKGFKKKLGLEVGKLEILGKEPKKLRTAKYRSPVKKGSLSGVGGRKEEGERSLDRTGTGRGRGGRRRDEYKARWRESTEKKGWVRGIASKEEKGRRYGGASIAESASRGGGGLRAFLL